MHRHLRSSLPLNLWWRLRVALWTSPTWHAIYERFVRLSRPRLLERLVDQSSDLVIEAFPRSANTFIVWALRDSTDRPLRIAHHLHDLIQVERGLIYQLPVVVIIRNPLDAFVSYRLRSPELNVSTMHSMYASFYGRVLELADQILLLRYEDVIGQPDAVLARIHDLLGTPEDARRPIDVSRVFDAVDKAEQNLRLAQGRPAGRSTEQDAAFATSVARPTAAKESGKQIAIDDLKNHHATAIASAHGLYEQVLERCVSFDKTSA